MSVPVRALAPPGVSDRRAPLAGAAGAAAVLCGVTAVVVAWFGAASSADVEEQVPWGVVGVAGTGLVCLTAALWLGAARLALVRRRRHVTRLLAGRLPQAGPVLVSLDGPAERLVATSAMTHYHRDGCPLAAGKDVRPASQSAHERDGRTPCGVCKP